MPALPITCWPSCSRQHLMVTELDLLGSSRPLPAFGGFKRGRSVSKQPISSKRLTFMALLITPTPRLCFDLWGTFGARHTISACTFAIGGRVPKRASNDCWVFAIAVAKPKALPQSFRPKSHPFVALSRRDNQMPHKRISLREPGPAVDSLEQPSVTFAHPFQVQPVEYADRVSPIAAATYDA